MTSSDCMGDPDDRSHHEAESSEFSKSSSGWRDYWGNDMGLIQSSQVCWAEGPVDPSECLEKRQAIDRELYDHPFDNEVKGLTSLIRRHPPDNSGRPTVTNAFTSLHSILATIDGHRKSCMENPFTCDPMIRELSTAQNLEAEIEEACLRYEGCVSEEEDAYCREVVDVIRTAVDNMCHRVLQSLAIGHDMKHCDIRDLPDASLALRTAALGLAACQCNIQVVIGHVADDRYSANQAVGRTATILRGLISPTER